MDKNRDFKRGASRLSRVIKSQHKLSSGLDDELVVSLEKPKKERTKKLTSVVNNKANSSKEEREMDCDLLSHREASQAQSVSNGPASKKFKLPKKFLHDCNNVDHASVPRKLRSAMKRNYEPTPTFTDSKRLNRTISQGELPKNNGVKKTKQYNKDICSDVSPKQTVSGSITKDEEEVAETLFVLAGMFLEEDEKNKNNKQEDKDSPTNAFEGSAVTKDKLNSVRRAKTSDYTLPAEVDSSTKGEENVNEHPNLQEIKKFQIESETSIPKANLPFIRPTSTKKEDADEKLLSKPANICLLPKLTVDNGIKQPIFLGSSLLKPETEIALGARATESQLSQQLAISESWKNGLLMWSGSSSTTSYCSQILHAPSQVPASKNPPWLDAALSASKPSPLETDRKLKIAEKPFKRCAAHVYICRLIQTLQMPCKTTSALQSNLSRQNEGSKQQFLTVVKDSDISMNGLQESNNYGPRNLNKDRNDIIQHNNQPQAASYNQNFDFLSLTAGGGSGISPGNYVRSGYGLESRSQQFQVPFIPPTRYNSSAYSDQLAAAQQVQMQRPHIGSSLNGMNTRASIHMTHSNDKQQQHQFWAGATQQRSTAQYPSWQNGRLESSELLKYPQQLTSTGVGFRNNGGALSLQLLCTDRLY